MTTNESLLSAALMTEEQKTELLTLRGQACFFTGHRNISTAAQTALYTLLCREVESLVYRGFTIFYSGAARGFDLLAASAVLQQMRRHNDLRLILAIPCPMQDRGWRQQDHQLYQMIRARGECYLLSETWDKDCMRRRNQFIVDAAIMGITYYTGNNHTGTAQTIRYADRQNIPMLRLAEFLKGTI